MPASEQTFVFVQATVYLRLPVWVRDISVWIGRAGSVGAGERDADR